MKYKLTMVSVLSGLMMTASAMAFYHDKDHGLSGKKDMHMHDSMDKHDDMKHSDDGDKSDMKMDEMKASDMRLDDIVLLALAHADALEDITEVNMFQLQFVDKKLNNMEVEELNDIRMRLIDLNDKFFELIGKLGEDDLSKDKKESLKEDILENHKDFGKEVIDFDMKMEKALMNGVDESMKSMNHNDHSMSDENFSKLNPNMKRY